ncbi:putative nuclear pore protein NUP57 [Scedosporium apiospermum]|uniref:Putative nuclear pore protein NUP57 n=1 Tax=Pseudallescheria apiosperma TaxID=563466 RepID=A0A084FWE9_PSEDA|nr:putative nuclear pore protein NUP57 [Scedosporium apiospermum]KEZ39411.1 putative nuclear pore protein NUP57 [Scedosporium apiospermum]
MSSIFARPAGQSIFGASQQQQQQQQAAPAQGSIFGQAAPLAASVQQPQQQAPQLPTLAQSQAQLSSSLWQPVKETPLQKPLTEQIQQLMEKWDPANPNCVFKHYFYNKVDESNIPFYKPLPHENPREWEEALQKKPAPGFIPVMCAGFTGLSDRLKTQKRAVADLNTRLHQINGALDAILSRHDLQTSVRAAAARRRHTVLQERCIGLAAKVQVLRNRGYALSGDEDHLRLKLKALEASIQDPALSAKEEELWSRLIVIRGYAERLTQEINKPASRDEEQLDEETEIKAKKVLEDYEKQLLHLKKEVETIKNDFEQWEKDRDSTS